MNTVTAMLTDGPSEHSQFRSWLALLHAGAQAQHNLPHLLENFGTAEAVIGAVKSGSINRSHLPQRVLERLRKPD